MESDRNPVKNLWLCFRGVANKSILTCPEETAHVVRHRLQSDGLPPVEVQHVGPCRVRVARAPGHDDPVVVQAGEGVAGRGAGKGNALGGRRKSVNASERATMLSTATLRFSTGLEYKRRHKYRSRTVALPFKVA